MTKRIQFCTEGAEVVEEFDASTEMIEDHDVLYTLEWMEPGVVYGVLAHEEYENIIFDELGDIDE